jgi:choline dehydrogenase
VCDLSQRSVQVGLRYTAAGSMDRNDMQLLIVVPVDLTHSPQLVARAGAERIFMIGAGLQRVYSRGRITYADAEPVSAPTIELNIGSDPRDMAKMRDGIRLAWRTLHSGEFDSYFERVALFDEAWLSDDGQLDDYIRGNVITFKHPACTARMGVADDPDTVTDPQGRVRGVHGLRISDASIMPVIPRANTNLTCVALGERMADLLAREDRGEPIGASDRSA